MEVPALAQWLQNTGDSVFSRRDVGLKRIDAALEQYINTRTPEALRRLDLELKAWKGQNPRWATSVRNAKSALTHLSMAMQEKVDPLLNQQDFLWCPSFDKEMRDCAVDMKKHLHLHSGVFDGVGAPLHTFGIHARLYILCHGHAKFPVFCCNNQEWSPARLADMLIETGINPQIRQIELLVCHAGESVNTVENAADMLLQQYTNRALVNDGALDDEIAAGKDKIQEMSRKVLPTHYERHLGSDGFSKKTDEMLDKQGEWLLPLAASFANALKVRNLTNFVLTSYKGEVVQNPEPKNFVNTATGAVVKTTKAGIKLNLPPRVIKEHADLRKWDQLTQGNHSAFVLASEYPSFIATWR